MCFEKKKKRPEVDEHADTAANDLEGWIKIQQLWLISNPDKY
jgi:hypothetical protein